MRKIALMLAAAATVWLAVPAAAQTLVIKQGGMHRHHHDGMHRDRGYRARAEWRHRNHRFYGKRHHRGPAIVIQR